jgi:hypothetical protein
MDEYLTTYQVQNQPQDAEPTCSRTDPAGHCWHGPAGLNDYRADGFSQVCCWCGVLKLNRRNPNAHGPHEPNRRTIGYGGSMLGLS